MRKNVFQFLAVSLLNALQRCEMQYIILCKFCATNQNRHVQQHHFSLCNIWNIFLMQSEQYEREVIFRRNAAFAKASRKTIHQVHILIVCMFLSPSFFKLISNFLCFILLLLAKWTAKTKNKQYWCTNLY